MGLSSVNVLSKESVAFAIGSLRWVVKTDFDSSLYIYGTLLVPPNTYKFSGKTLQKLASPQISWCRYINFSCLLSGFALVNVLSKESVAFAMDSMK